MIFFNARFLILYLQSLAILHLKGFLQAHLDVTQVMLDLVMLQLPWNQGLLLVRQDIWELFHT